MPGGGGQTRDPAYGPRPRRRRGGACSCLRSPRGRVPIGCRARRGPRIGCGAAAQLTWRAGTRGPMQRGRKRHEKRAGAGGHHAAGTGAVSRALGGRAASVLHHRGDRPEPPGRPGHSQAHDPHCQGEGRGRGRLTVEPRGELRRDLEEFTGRFRKARSRELSGSVLRVSLASAPQLDLPGALARPLRLPADPTSFFPFPVRLASALAWRSPWAPYQTRILGTQPLPACHKTPRRASRDHWFPTTTVVGSCCSFLFFHLPVPVFTLLNGEKCRFRSADPARGISVLPKLLPALKTRLRGVVMSIK